MDEITNKAQVQKFKVDVTIKHKYLDILNVHKDKICAFFGFESVKVPKLNENTTKSDCVEIQFISESDSCNINRGEIAIGIQIQWVGSIDLIENEQADVSIVVPRDGNWTEQEDHVVSKVGEALNGEKLDAIICVAGGWAGGNAQKDLAKNSDMMWKQSVWTSAISAAVSAQYLKEGGVLALTGAKPALKGTPGMIGYGMAKAAVHQLTKSLSEKDSGLPDGSLVVAILPITLDTPMNRKWMPKADFSTWTPLSYVAEIMLSWTKNKDRPTNGSLLQLVTKEFQTSLVASD